MEKTMMTTRIEAKTAFDQEEVNQGHCHQWDFREVLLGDFVRPDFGGLALVMQSKGESVAVAGHLCPQEPGFWRALLDIALRLKGNDRW